MKPGRLIVAAPIVAAPIAAAPVAAAWVAAAWIAAAVGAAALLPAAAMAQVPPTGNPVPQGSPIPRIRPAAPPALGGPAPAVPGAVAPGAVPDTTVTIRSVAVEGGTVYSDDQLRAITAPLAGPVKLAAVEQARAAILGLYRADGYVLTAVSANLAANGALRFIVTEGRIADVKLDGDIGPAGTQVLRFLRHLTEVRPIDSATLERWLLLAQDVPGVALRAVLRPSTDEPGALTLVAQVQRQSWNALFTADNRAFNLTGPEEWLTVLDANSFTEYGERSEVTLYQTARSTQIFGQASVEAFVGGSGLKVRLYAGSGTADPSGDLGALGYHGITTIAGASASYPLIKRRQEVLNLAAYFDILQSTINTDTGPNNSSAKASEDNLRVFRLGGDYARQDLLLGNSRPAINTALLRLSQGIPGLGATSQYNPTAGRLNENPGFFKANFELTRTQTLFQPWDGASVSLYGLVSGQWSNDILPPSEKFFLGGQRITRGFYAGEVTGDKSLTTSIELQLNTALDVQVFNTPIALTAQYYGFWDWGETWQNQRTDPNVLLSSAGGGVRLNITRYTEVDFEGVRRFTTQPQPGSNIAPLAGSAFYWRVLARF